MVVAVVDLPDIDHAAPGELVEQPADRARIVRVDVRRRMSRRFGPGPA